MEQICGGLFWRVNEVWKKRIASVFLDSRRKAREWRIIKDPEQIRVRLATQLSYAMNQMQKESLKLFTFLSAPKDWKGHQKTIGRYQVGISHAQGRRLSMEDEHLATSFDLKIGNHSYPIHLFGIFDGHGGRGVAKYVKNRLQEYLQRALVKFNPKKLSDDGIWRALKLFTVQLNHDLKRQNGAMALYQGTTAAIALVLNQQLWTANVGDSRVVVDNDGEPIQITEDAKPEDPRYRRGIEKRGGVVEEGYGTPRVNGRLAMARAIGDYGLNEAISARSKVTMIPLKDLHTDHQLILCCDGIYEVARTKDIVTAAHEHKTLSADNLARNIVYSAYEAGSGDNLSCMIVRSLKN